MPNMVSRLYEISEEIFCNHTQHKHGQQTQLAISSKGTWELKPASSTPEVIALRDRPYYLFVRPYGLYHPGLCGVLPSLRPLLFPSPSPPQTRNLIGASANVPLRQQRQMGSASRVSAAEELYLLTLRDPGIGVQIHGRGD